MLATLKQYQAWRTGEDGRTMEEIGLTPKKISEALEWAINELEGHGMTTETIMKDDIKLPPLPRGDIAADTCPTMWVHTDQQLQDYARAAIKYDRKRRGEPEALIREAALHLTNWLTLGECECEGPGHQCGRTQVERCRDRLLDAAPQPTAPAQEPSDSEIMWEWANTKNTEDMRVDLVVFARALLARYGSKS